MGFGFVKILEGSNVGKKKYVKLQDITPSLKGLEFKENSIYKFKGTKIKIILTKETQEELMEAVKKINDPNGKRKRELPDHLLESATSTLSELDDEPSTKKKKTQKDSDEKTKKEEKRLKNFARSLNMSVVDVQDILQNKPTATGHSSFDSTISQTKKNDPREGTSTSENTSILTDKNNEKREEKVADNRSSKKLKNLEEKPDIKELRKEIIKQQQKIDVLKEKNEELKTLLQSSQDHNRQLQTEVIDRFSEFFTIVEQRSDLNEAKQAVEPCSNFLPIGRDRKSDGHYHISNGHWISPGTYNYLRRAESPTIFISRLLSVLWKEEVLKISTVYGKQSNRSKNKNKMDENQDPVEVRPLDSNLLQVAKDFYKYWLDHVYVEKPQNSKKKNKKPKKSKEEHYASFTSYVSKSLAYLKKDPESNCDKKDNLKNKDKDGDENTDSDKCVKSSSNLKNKDEDNDGDENQEDTDNDDDEDEEFTNSVSRYQKLKNNKGPSQSAKDDIELEEIESLEVFSRESSVLSLSSMADDESSLDKDPLA